MMRRLELEEGGREWEGGRAGWEEGGRDEEGRGRIPVGDGQF